MADVSKYKPNDQVPILRHYKPDVQASEPGLPISTRLRFLKLQKYKPEAQASGYFRGFRHLSLARRAGIETLRDLGITRVLQSRVENSLSNVQLQKAHVRFIDWPSKSFAFNLTSTAGKQSN